MLLAIAPPAPAQTKTGTTLGQFLLIEPSARFTAIGNAGVAAGEGIDGVYYNPAAAGRVSRLEFQLTHINWLAGIRYDYVAAAIPFKTWGTAFATVSSLNSGEIDVRTVSQPLGTGERYSVSNVALGLGFARSISERFSAGIQVKYFQETVWHSSAGTVTFDVGTVYRIRPDGLHIGSSISNFGTGARFSGRDLRITYDDDPTRAGDNGALPGERFVQAYPVPVLFRVGVGLPWRPAPDWRVWTSVEANHPNSNPESMSGGVEASFRDLFAIRAGYQGLFKVDSEEGLALGTGIKGRLEAFDYRIDYAWADYGRLGNVHRLTLAMQY
ncbi:PorV/PorQ family protein [Actinokineospora sp.]|uniref:PorV/PorQ family protein n=1 Tax=Actinokineospora sp. TaxID=1872133 RepID=UPI003D6A786B